MHSLSAPWSGDPPPKPACLHREVGFFVVATIEKQQKKQVKTDEEKKPNYGGWVLGVCVTLLLYVLSIGPATLVVGKIGGSSPRGFGVVYAPVTWLFIHTPLRGPLERYFMLWVYL